MGVSISNFFRQVPTLPITMTSCLHLGGACPPAGSVKDLLYLGSLRKKERGGGWACPAQVASMVKWLWEQPWDFSALGGPARSVFWKGGETSRSH